MCASCAASTRSPQRRPGTTARFATTCAPALLSRTVQTCLRGQCTCCDRAACSSLSSCELCNPSMRDALLLMLQLTTCLRPANAASFCSAPTDALLPGAQCFCFICEVPARQCQLWGSGAVTLSPAACNRAVHAPHTQTQIIAPACIAWHDLTAARRVLSRASSGWTAVLYAHPCLHRAPGSIRHDHCNAWDDSGAYARKRAARRKHLVALAGVDAAQPAPAAPAAAPLESAAEHPEPNPGQDASLAEETQVRAWSTAAVWRGAESLLFQGAAHTQLKRLISTPRSDCSICSLRRRHSPPVLQEA